MKTNPYPYAGNNPVNYTDPMGLDYDYVYWTHPYPNQLCKFSIDEHCDPDCFDDHFKGDCRYKHVDSIGYTRSYHQDGIVFVPRGTCKECWEGPCYHACKHLLPDFMDNDENSEMVECLNTAGCIPDENDPPPADGNQPLGDGGKGPYYPPPGMDPNDPLTKRLVDPFNPENTQPPTPTTPPNPSGTDPGNENDGEESKRFWGFGG